MHEANDLIPFDGECCMICGVNVHNVRSLRVGARACESCIRFFNRWMKNPPRMHHHVNSGKADNAERKTNNIYRKMCTACRFSRCIAAGFKLQMDCGASREEITLFSENIHYLTFSPPASEQQELEQNLLKLSDAYRTLKAHFQGMPLVTGQDQLPSTSFSETCRKCTDEFNSEAAHYSDFFRQLPFFSEIPEQDRLLLFRNAFVKISLALGSNVQEMDRVSVISLSQPNAGVLLSYLPRLRYTEEEARKFWKHFQTWNPKHIEMAFVLALAFYDETVGNVLQRPDIFDKALVTLLTMRLAVYQNLYNTGRVTADAVTASTENMRSTLGILREAQTRRSVVYRQLFEENRSFNLGTLFTETFHCSQNKA